MKNIFVVIMTGLITSLAFAQSPEKISYQAVVRDTDNALVTSSPIGMQLSVLQGSISGTAVYVEIQTLTSNVNGLVSLEIGEGTPISGDFTAINWADGPYFIKTETDPTGGTSYTIAGVSQLLSVPYALHSKIAETVLRDASVGYVYSDTIDNFELKTHNGVHNLYEISSSHEINNPVSQQFAFAGVTKDNHDPKDLENDSRAMLVHNDIPRQKTKLVVLEPGETTIAVLDASTTETSPLATVTMKDSLEEVLIGNYYSGLSNKQNIIRLGKESTNMEFIDVANGTSRVFQFSDNGMTLYHNGVLIHHINMDGTTTIDDVLKITPRSTLPSNPEKGTIYFDDSMNKLMVYDGTDWQACW